MADKDSTPDSRAARADAGALNATKVSSPVATGGAGTAFEQHVGAYWLAQLVVGAIPPILINASVTEVSLQTERLGWQTDDFLVRCTSGGTSHHIAGQVKRKITISAADETCVEVVGDFWKDFNAPHFSRENDRFVLVTLRGTNTLLEFFVGLLDCARASEDGCDFEQRLSLRGLVSSKASEYCGELQTIVGRIEGKTMTPAEIWPFVRLLHVLSLDLHTSTRQTEAAVKTLLAYTSTEDTAIESAAITWNALVAEASLAMEGSRTLRREDLPTDILARHGVINANERRVLQAFKEHTSPVLRAIRSTLGRTLHLPRSAIVQNLLEALEDKQVVLLAGPAGSGKSAIGKDAAVTLGRDHFLFAFRVEEFAQAHLDATLTAAQVPANWEKVRAILAAQGRKVVLVESVERLLERPTRDAFTDLMTLVGDDPSLRVILTCRDYSIEQVRASFLQPHQIQCTIVNVPPLDDNELASVEDANPALAIPFKSPGLRDVLRNPFVLDKALNINWSADNSLPQSEREFRAVFWREIVRGHGVSPAMGRQRDQVFQEIAVRRARALSAHVSAKELDSDAVESLRSNSLIASPDGNSLLVTTAHDVLEDWAILQWLEAQHLGAESFKALSESVGGHPAVRRSYRKWLAELLERDAAAADRLFHAALSANDITAQFRDDTLVALLKAPNGPDFLATHDIELRANNNSFLKLIIRLLRIACVRAADWIVDARLSTSSFSVPDGAIWTAVLRVVHKNLGTFSATDQALLLGLAEHAVRGVTQREPAFEGAEHAAAIAYWALDFLQGYGSDEQRKRALQVLAKVPNADSARFEALLRGHVDENQRLDRVAEELREMVYEGIDGWHVARDLPDALIAIAAEHLLASDDDIDEETRYRSARLDVGLYFGINEERSSTSHTASVLRGPWASLLRYHPRKALDFYIDVFTHSTDWYLHPRLSNRLEQAHEVELTFSSGEKCKQWVNERLWKLYRGMTVGPDSLMSMLMALENWLLQLGKQAPAQLEGVLVELLQRSNNAAISGVVASASIAHPHDAVEALLALLSVREFVVMDRLRLAREGMPLIPGFLPPASTEEHVFERERREASALPHRRQDLEWAAISLQFRSSASRVQALLDEHLAALPPKEQQGKADVRWRLALHRMDLRKYTPSEVTATEIGQSDEPSGEQARQYVRLDLDRPEADVQAVIDETASRLLLENARHSLAMWAFYAFGRETGKFDPKQWAAKVEEAQALEQESDPQDIGRQAPGLVASVCVRDHWDDMTMLQREWCVDTVCNEVLRHANNASHFDRAPNDPFAADRPCASVLQPLLGKDLDPTHMAAVKAAFAAAITHPIEQTRSYATWSVDETVWATNRTLALRCVNAIATEAALVRGVLEAQRERPYEERADIDEVMMFAAEKIRESFWEEAVFDDDAHTGLDLSDGVGMHAFLRVLVILGQAPMDPVAIAAFTRASRTLVERWTSVRDHRTTRDRDYHAESDLATRVEEFLLRTSAEAAHDVLSTLLTAVDDHPREVTWVMRGLTSIENAKPATPRYWFLWQMIAEAVKRAKWIPRVGTGRHGDGRDLLAAVFLTVGWNQGVRHWRALDGHAHLVDAFFEDLSPTYVVLDHYVQFLYHIGERSLPQAFVRIATALRRGEAPKMLSVPNTMYVLEELLQRYVYGRPLELKRDSGMREAVLTILDCLVEAGSSAAFRMRDDFVTPAGASS